MNERERNRREFPEAAAFVDRMRSVFGTDVRLRWWVENGKTIGPVPQDVMELFEKQHHINGTAGGSCQIASSGTSS